MLEYEKGFTLVELIVVIAIIAVLSAVLFPSYLDALEKAKIGSTISMIREIGRQLAMSYNEKAKGFSIYIGEDGKLKNISLPQKWEWDKSKSFEDLGKPQLFNNGNGLIVTWSDEYVNARAKKVMKEKSIGECPASFDVPSGHYYFVLDLRDVAKLLVYICYKP